MLWKSVAGPFAVVVVAGVTACSSSNGTPTPDGGGDAPTGADSGHHTDAGRDSGHVKDSSAHDASDAPSGDAEPNVPTARFKLTSGTTPNFLDVPFPSDIYLSAGKVMTIPGLDSVIKENANFLTNEIAKLNGFSRVALSLFYIDDGSEPGGIATIDPTTVPTSESLCIADQSSVFLLDLTAATPAAARIRCRAQFHDDRAFGTNVARPVLAVGPGRGVVLEEGHQYAAVITSRLKTLTGKNVAASADFLALGAGLYQSTLGQANMLLSSALATDNSTIVDIAPFTTNSESSVLFKMRTNLATNVPVPTLSWDTASMAPMGAVKFAAPVGGVLPTPPSGGPFTDTLDHLLGVVTAPTLPDGSDDPDGNLPVRAHNRIAAIGTAVFTAQNYLQQLGGYTTLNNATFTFDANGNVVPPTANPTDKIWVTFFVPTAAMPANGYPLVIVQHGLGESRHDEAFNLANVFANAGWMVAAIDSVTFGARAPEAEYQQDTLNAWQNASLGATYVGPDGLGDPVDMSGTPSLTGSTNGVSDFFGSLLDMGAIRDQLRQAEIDTSQLARVLASNPDLSPLQTGATAPKIDATKIAYFGNSLGAIEGAAAAAVEPLIQSWILNVGGGGVAIEIAAHSPTVSSDLELAAGFNFGLVGDHFTESHPLVTLFQTAFDPGDPLTFASYLIQKPGTVSGTALTPKNILQIEVVYDNYVPNEANEALARAIGLGLAMPNVGTNAGVSTMEMVRDQTKITDPLPLANIAPNDAGLISNTPMSGVTAVLVQTMPGTHGHDYQFSTSQQTFAIPYNQFTTANPFVTLADAGGPDGAPANPPFNITCSYRNIQATGVRFLSDAFAGNVPNVTGFLPPVRDFDQDTNPDSTDPDPNNPNIH